MFKEGYKIMDDYKSAFEQKLHYVMQMVGQFGQFKVPTDFWEIWAREGDQGRTFRPKNLKEMFVDDYERMLKACAVTVQENKKGITFVANELL